MKTKRSQRTIVRIHAGAVAFSAGVILLPGYSCSGKSTLSAALTALGGILYADDMAEIDSRGRLRAEALPPKNVALILHSQYIRGSHFSPRTVSPSAAPLLLLRHIVYTEPDHQPRVEDRGQGDAAGDGRDDQGEEGRSLEDVEEDLL